MDLHSHSLFWASHLITLIKHSTIQLPRHYLFILKNNQPLLFLCDLERSQFCNSRLGCSWTAFKSLFHHLSTSCRCVLIAIIRNSVYRCIDFFFLTWIDKERWSGICLNGDSQGCVLIRYEFVWEKKLQQRTKSCIRLCFQLKYEPLLHPCVHRARSYPTGHVLQPAVCVWGGGGGWGSVTEDSSRWVHSGSVSLGKLDRDLSLGICC